MNKSKLAIVGGGLAAALIAQRLGQSSETQIEVFEAEGEAFGQHTWSFHTTDVTAEDLIWLEPLIAHRWGSQTVRFQDYERHLETGYASLTSRSVASAFSKKSHVKVLTNSRVIEVCPEYVRLETGDIIPADCVIDARGYRQTTALKLGYQKFVGLEVEIPGGHGLSAPVIMDATVDQLDGYRFVYLLPFSSTRILIEDTRYADGESLDESRIELDILAYTQAQGWPSPNILRRERGVLPIALAFDENRFWSEVSLGVPQAGMRAALFHPTTGYSLPEAVKVANVVAEAWPVSSEQLSVLIKNFALKRCRQQRFYRLLNRLLFLAAQPNKRHLVLQRFYKLPKPLIERFYAGKTTKLDIARIMLGKPPVPIKRAMSCLSETALLETKR